MIGLLIGLAAAATPADWKTYVNVRYGYSACYPASFRAGREADNSDGRPFEGPAGGKMLVYGTNDQDGQSAEDVVRDQANSVEGVAGRMTYFAKRANWAVSSGTAGGRIFYTKAFKRGDQLLVLYINYPKSAQRTYGPIVNSISRCFTVGTPGF